MSKSQPTNITEAAKRQQKLMDSTDGLTRDPSYRYAQLKDGYHVREITATITHSDETENAVVVRTEVVDENEETHQLRALWVGKYGQILMCQDCFEDAT